MFSLPHYVSNILLWLTVNLESTFSTPVHQYIELLCRFFRLCLSIISPVLMVPLDHVIISKDIGIWAMWFLYCETISWSQYLQHNTSIVILVFHIFSVFCKLPSFCSLQGINFILGNWWNMYAFWGNWKPSLLLSEKAETNVKMEKTRINIKVFYCITLAFTWGFCHTLNAYCSHPIDTLGPPCFGSP